MIRMTMLNVRTVGAFVMAAALVAGCRVDALPKNDCLTTADCNSGNSCQQGICVGDSVVGGGGGCATVPAAACSQPEGTEHPLDHSEILRLLPGRWLWCSGDKNLVDGTEFILGPDGTVGIDFNVDATLWWFLVNDGHGNPVHRDGFDSNGTVEILGMPNFVQLNLVLTSNSVFTLNPSFTDGPPKHMRLVSHGPAAYYVHDDSCTETSGATDIGTGTVDMGGGGAFGGACNPNVVVPDSCPSVNGVTCSICGYATMTWQCLQPCHVAANDCTTPQTCIAFDEYVLSGDCIGYDGYCQ
jgi:hypothetical protein